MKMSCIKHYHRNTHSYRDLIYWVHEVVAKVETDLELKKTSIGNFKQ